MNPVPDFVAANSPVSGRRAPLLEWLQDKMAEGGVLLIGARCDVGVATQVLVAIAMHHLYLYTIKSVVFISRFAPCIQTSRRCSGGAMRYTFENTRCIKNIYIIKKAILLHTFYTINQICTCHRSP